MMVVMMIVIESFSVGKNNKQHQEEHNSLLAQHLPNNPGTLPIGPSWPQSQPIHGIQDPPMHRLHPIACIGQSAAQNDGQGVLHEGARNFVGQIDRVLPRGGGQEEFVGGAGHF
jgi:hypothetical protein